MACLRRGESIESHKISAETGKLCLNTIRIQHGFTWEFHSYLKEMHPKKRICKVDMSSVGS